jgi:hypothetical protein
MTQHFLVMTYTNRRVIEPYVGQQCLSSEALASQYAEGMKAVGASNGETYVSVTRSCSGSTCEVL